MEITRNNYENFVIDFLEKTLSKDEMICFELFLSENKDIAEEIIGINNISLKPEKIIYDDKLLLKKTEFSDELNCSYFEELCVRKVEDDLSIEQYNDFNKLIKEKKENKIIYQNISKTKLKPDLKKIFTAKEQLKKTIFLSKNFFYTISSVAAAIIFIFITIKFINVQPNENHASNLKNNSINILNERNIINEKDELANLKNDIFKVNKSIKKDILNSDIDNSISTENLVLRDNSNIASIDNIKNGKIIGNNINNENIITNSSNQKKLSIIEKYNYTKIQIANIFNRKIHETEEIVTNPIDLAQTAIKGYNNLTESSIKLEKVYDESGNFIALNLSAENFDFSTNKIGR